MPNTNLEDAAVMIVMRPSDLEAMIQRAVKAAVGSSAAPELMPAKEVGEKLKVSADLVRLWAREGDGRPSGEKCPHIRVGKKKLIFRLDAVIEWLESAES